MPKISKKDVVWLLTGAQSVLCFAFFLAWVAASALLATTLPEELDENTATFMIVALSVFCIVMAVVIFKWNRRTSVILWKLLMAGLGSLTLTGLMSAPKSEDFDHMFGFSAFTDLPRWCFWALVVLFASGFIMCHSLIGIVANVFFYTQMVFIVALIMMVFVRYVVVPRRAG